MVKQLGPEPSKAKVKKALSTEDQHSHSDRQTVKSGGRRCGKHAAVPHDNRNAMNSTLGVKQMGQWVPILRSKVAYRIRREGVLAAVCQCVAATKHAFHQIVYDRWLDRRERRPSGRTYIIREDEMVGPPPPAGERLYRPFPRLPLLWSIEGLAIDVSAYSFVNYGSGRGRLLLAAARLPFRRVVGVEFAHSLHQDACENIAHYPRDKIACADIVSLNLNAMDFDLPAGNVVAFFFNPFTVDVLEQVAQRIENACRAAPRSVYIIFANSNRLRVFAARPAFRRFKPELLDRIRLATMAPVPIEFFSVGLRAIRKYAF
jgi:hypothetical protein